MWLKEAMSAIVLLAASVAHFLQCRPVTPSAPHTAQIFGGRRKILVRIVKVFPLPSLLRRWVSRVGRICSPLDEFREEFQSAWAIHSAAGAANLCHVSAVSQSFLAKGDPTRQLPSLFSQKSALRKGSV